MLCDFRGFATFEPIPATSEFRALAEGFAGRGQVESKEELREAA